MLTEEIKQRVEVGVLMENSGYFSMAMAIQYLSAIARAKAVSFNELKECHAIAHKQIDMGISNIYVELKS